MKKKILAGLAVGVMIFGFASVSQATSVTTNLTADDAFNLYISTDDTQLGTFVGGHEGWEETQSFSFLLTPITTNYIHIVAWDLYGTIASVIGDFTLSDADFEFSNGAQKLLTNTTDWNVFTDAFGGSAAIITDQGANGVDPWGVLPSIDSQARWIWTGEGLDMDTRYFSASITTTAPVPEPASMLLIGSGLLGLLGLSKRRS